MSNHAVASRTSRKASTQGTLAFLAAGFLILALAPAALLLSEALWLRWLAIMSLAWWLPGTLLVAHWRLPDQDITSAAVLAAGLGLCWMMLVALLVHWLPGPVGLWPLIAAYELGALALLLALFWHRPRPLRPTPAATWGWVVALILIACLLRVPGLDYHELHGDETMVLHKARSAIWGADDVMARHAKGPGEIAVAMVAYRAMGTANESTARLPFALMGVLGVLAISILGRRLFSPAVGTLAGLLLALNGFALALSRIVQYQPAVLLLCILAVLCAWEFALRGEGRWLALVAVFSGFGILLHYEYGLMAPVLLVLAWVGWRRAPDRRQVLIAALIAAAVAAAIVAATYLPGFLDPRFARTQRYLGSRLGGFGAFNLPIFTELGTFYQGTYFFLGLILLVIAGLVVGWRTARRRILLLALWVAPFLILHIFVMQHPGTHFYLFMPGWSLLAALPLAALAESKTIKPILRWGALALVAIWMAVSAGYLYLAFFQQSPEYVANYDQAQVPFYWAPYGEQVPVRPRYAFPIQEGWKTLGTLAEWGCLDGTFASNEGSQSLRFWYLFPLARVGFEAAPDYVFVASHLQAAYPQYDEGRLAGYQHVGEVRLRDEPRIEIWAREPLPVAYVTYHAEDFAYAFDRAVPMLEDWPEPPATVTGARLGEVLTLESGALTPEALTGGDTLHLLLVWRPQQALARDYKVFVHVTDRAGRPLAQWDGRPCMNTGATSQWKAGEPVRDHVLMAIPEDLAAGEYSVVAGLYDEATGERLGGQAIEIGTIAVH
jgi:4-amino-4-deoxy-L-arabinose transferase-like glycosyltransferase